jgi:hypothetical protein
MRVLIFQKRYTEAEAIVQYCKKALELARRNNDHRVMIFKEALNNLKSTKK